MAQLYRDTLYITGPVNDHLSHYYTWIKDCSKISDPSAIVDSFEQHRFKRQPLNSSFNQGYTHCNYWIAVSVKNDTVIPLKLVWNFYNNGLRFVLYDITDHNHILAVDSGSMHLPMEERSYPLRSVSFPFTLSPGQYKQYLVKISLTNADNIQVPTDLTTAEDDLQWETGYSFAIGWYIGAFTLATLFNLLLWAVLRYKLHLWHGLYVASLILFNISDFHFDSHVFTGRAFYYWSLLPKPIFFSMAVFFSMNVFQRFIDQRQRFPFFFHLFQLSKLILLIVITSTVIAAYALPFYNDFSIACRITSFIFPIACIFLTLCNIIVGAIQKNTTIILYFISVLPVLVATADYILIALNISHRMLVHPGNLLIGLLVEVIILSIFFVYKYRKERNDGYNALNRLKEEQESFSEKIIIAEEEERRRIARDIHDDISGTLSSLRFYTNNHFRQFPPESNGEKEFRVALVEILEKLATNIRNISHNLMPSDIEEGGLTGSLEQMVMLLNQRSEIIFEFIRTGTDEKLSVESKLSTYRCISELIQNVIKHAQATKVSIQMIEYAGYLQLQVGDNGKGFDMQKKGLGIGLSDVKARLSFLKGEMQIESNKLGTLVILSIPLNS